MKIFLYWMPLMETKKMRILLIIPGLSPAFSEAFYLYKEIADKGNQILVITAQRVIKKDKNKYLDKIEDHENIKILRLFKKPQDINNWMKILIKFKTTYQNIIQFCPDIILCSQQSNMKLAFLLKRIIRIPIVLIMEKIYDPLKPNILLRKRAYLGINFLGNILGYFYWTWIYRNADSVITANFNDEKNFRKIERKNKKLNFVQWPSFPPVIEFDSVIRDDNRAVFIGNFTRHKNLNEFSKTIPKLIENTKLKEFIIVGDGKETKAINNLTKRYPNNIKHIRALSREKCLELIAGSYFTYNPSIGGSWGLILDTWAAKTALVVSHNHFNFQDNEDCLIVTKENIVDKINLLYNNKDIYKQIVNGGYNRYLRQHSNAAIAELYLKIISKTLNKESEYL
ncbi:MAG: glycosyltransferase [Candidatus Lokiarchaeota archaeon]|nr:glycosyltransferase [Candidatus Lokiarchaeota archaeon]